MNTLPLGFEYSNHGYKLRFVNEDDAPFIVELRTQDCTKGFLHDTSSDVQDQVNWIKKYKVREGKGEDYYFVVEHDKVPLGLIRIYNIHERIFTLGSWVMAPDASLGAILASTILIREVAFDILELDTEDAYDGVNVLNKKVLKFNLDWGMKPYKYYSNELGEFVSLKMTKEDYKVNVEKKIKLLNNCL